MKIIEINLFKKYAIYLVLEKENEMLKFVYWLNIFFICRDMSSVIVNNLYEKNIIVKKK